MEQKLGIKVNGFAVPFGYINDEVREVIRKAGYEAVFTVYGQHLTQSSPNDSLGRYLMEGNKPKVFSDAANFGSGSSSGGGAAAVSEISVADLQSVPTDGETVKTSTPLIKANLAKFGDDRPGQRADARERPGPRAGELRRENASHFLSGDSEARISPAP